MSYSVKPGRGPSAIGGAAALIIGVPFMIYWTASAPSEMKLFGVLGLLAAVGVAIYNLYNAFAGARDRVSEHEIVRSDDDLAGDFRTESVTESRLRELESLRSEGLITEAEFERKRAGIIADL